jgi:carboxyl-terminal processing protease
LPYKWLIISKLNKDPAMLSRSLFLFLLLIFLSLNAKPPELTPRETRVKIEEILKAHVSHQKLTPELMERALNNYLDEIDPSKTYFIEPEIAQWLNPSKELKERALKECTRDNFSLFEEIHNVALKAIQRREAIEQRIKLEELPSKVEVTEFKDIKWATSEEELFERNRRIKALQIEAAEKIDLENKENFLKRLEKRRLKWEEELMGATGAERKQVILSLVLKSISSALDSQTHYFTPTEARQFVIQVQQKLSGIGAQLRDDLTGLTITRLLDGGPAVKTGHLKIGDRIIAVDGQAIIGMEISEAVELIRGKEGTSLSLTILRPAPEGEDKEEEKLEIKITRGEVVLAEGRFEAKPEPFAEGVIAHLKLHSFYQDDKSSSATDLYDALYKMKKEHNVQGVVLDLRNNTGGILPQAVAVAGLFIKKGVVVSIKDNTGRIQNLRNLEGKTAWDGPLIILTNKASASASEIVAQTLQDYGRAIVVGDATTFGKGTFQTFTLETASFSKVNPTGEYKVTRGRYYTVSGKSPQLDGVKADIVVPGLLSTLELGESYAKYPLESDSISPLFEDDLSDLAPHYRNQLIRYYREDRQAILTTYLPYITTLKENSEWRLKNDQNYQNFLSQIEKKDFSSETVEFFGQSDLQFVETLNVMKDLLMLTKENIQTAEAS